MPYPQYNNIICSILQRIFIYFQKTQHLQHDSKKLFILLFEYNCIIIKTGKIKLFLAEYCGFNTAVFIDYASVYFFEKEDNYEFKKFSKITFIY